MTNEHRQIDASTQRIGKFMVAGAWIGLLVMLTVMFNEFLEHQRNPNRDITVTTSAGQPQIVELQRNRFGHYVATGRINGIPVDFMVDTGATDVSIPKKLAAELNLQAGAPVRYQTANGSVIGNRTNLDTVSLGGIVLQNVAGSIHPGYDGDSVLLGMSWLRRLEFSQRGDTLILHQPIDATATGQ